MDAYYEFMNDSVNRLLIGPQVNPIALPHFHSCYEIFYVTENALSATVSGKSAHLKAGDLYLAESFAVHSNLTDGRCQGILLIVPESMVRPCLESKGGRAFLSPFLVGSSGGPAASGSKEILHCLRAIFDLDGRGLLDSLAVQGYVYVIFGILIQNIGLSQTFPDEVGLLPKDVLLYMKEHFAEPLPLEKIAEQFGYSAVYFSRFFHKYFGCGFHEYLTLLRLRNTVSLVTKEGSTFAAAALESGFENQRTFNRAFLKTYGTTPSAFVANIKQRRG